MMGCLVPTQTFRWLIHTQIMRVCDSSHPDGATDKPVPVGRTLQQAYQDTDTGAAVWQAVPEAMDYDQPRT